MYICAGDFTVHCWENRLQSFVFPLSLFCFSEQPIHYKCTSLLETFRSQKSVHWQVTSRLFATTVTWNWTIASVTDVAVDSYDALQSCIECVRMQLGKHWHLYAQQNVILIGHIPLVVMYKALLLKACGHVLDWFCDGASFHVYVRYITFVPQVTSLFFKSRLLVMTHFNIYGLRLAVSYLPAPMEEKTEEADGAF
jgi:hypothetical protein